MKKLIFALLLCALCIPAYAARTSGYSITTYTPGHYELVQERIWVDGYWSQFLGHQVPGHWEVICYRVWVGGCR